MKNETKCLGCGNKFTTQTNTANEGICFSCRVVDNELKKETEDENNKIIEELQEELTKKYEILSKRISHDIETADLIRDIVSKEIEMEGYCNQ